MEQKPSLRILYISPFEDINEKNSAPIIHILEVVKNLSSSHEVLLIIKGAKKEKELLSDTHIHILSPIETDNLHTSILFEAIRAVFVILKCHRRFHPDLLYVRYDNPLNFTPFLARLLRKPVVLEVNGLFLDESMMRWGGKKGLRYKIYSLLERMSFLNATRIVCVTHGIKRGLITQYSLSEERLVVIENGVDTELFKPMPKMEAMKKLPMKYVREEDQVVCFTGMLVSWQGVEYLIEAAPKILHNVPDARFLIIGDGNMRKELECLAASKNILGKTMFFTGKVPHDEIPNYINVSDISVIYKKLAKSGYSSLKLYEYMACGKPIVANRGEGFEILEEKNAGVLAEPENPDALAHAIIELLISGEKRMQMGKSGRELVENRYSWKTTANKVAEVCREAAGK